jgi:hypothetical protein
MPTNPLSHAFLSLRSKLAAKVVMNLRVTSPKEPSKRVLTEEWLGARDLFRLLRFSEGFSNANLPFLLAFPE